MFKLCTTIDAFNRSSLDNEIHHFDLICTYKILYLIYQQHFIEIISYGESLLIISFQIYQFMLAKRLVKYNFIKPELNYIIFFLSFLSLYLLFSVLIFFTKSNMIKTNLNLHTISPYHDVFENNK